MPQLATDDVLQDTPPCPACGTPLTTYESAPVWYCRKKQGGCGRLFTSKMVESKKAGPQLHPCAMCGIKRTYAKHCSSCAKWVSKCQHPNCAEQWRHTHLVQRTCQFHLCQQPFLDRNVQEGKHRRYCSDQCRRRQDQINYKARKKTNRTTDKAKRTRQGKVTHDITTLQLLVMQHYKCSLCGETIDVSLTHTHPKSLTADHTIPLARGGTHDITNLTAAHRDCNSRKKDRHG